MTIALPSREEPTLESLSHRMRLARGLLYLGSALLTLDSLFIGNWVGWPAELLVDEQNAEQLRRLALGISVHRGTAQTLASAMRVSPCFVDSITSCPNAGPAFY